MNKYICFYLLKKYIDTIIHFLSKIICTINLLPTNLLYGPNYSSFQGQCDLKHIVLIQHQITKPDTNFSSSGAKEVLFLYRFICSYVSKKQILKISF